jgi:hypothetical protein
MAVVGTVIVVVAVMVTRGESMFSPGELNSKSRGSSSLGGVTSHAEIKNCSSCHAPPWGGETMANRCLNCHTDVRKQIDRSGPLHGQLANGMECRKCHTEHRGSHSEMTNLASFDHDCAAFKLTGKHRTVNCKSCHTGSAYKGTPQTCESCHTHAQPKSHKEKKFGTNCAQCHGTSTWAVSTTSLVGFDHDRTGLKLTGKHSTVSCASCHVNNVFKGTPKTCVSCHAEPPVPKVHKARYGMSCAQCHSTLSWKGATFEHKMFSITHGSRRNATRQNTCATCHTDTNDFKKYTCYNCHEHRPEKIARIHARRNVANLDNCVSCHGRGRRRRAQLMDVEGARFVMAQVCPVNGRQAESCCAERALDLGTLRPVNGRVTAIPGLFCQQRSEDDRLLELRENGLLVPGVPVGKTAFEGVLMEMGFGPLTLRKSNWR